MGIAASLPLTYAEPSQRTSYLRKTAALTLAGLVISSFSGLVSASAIAVLPQVFGNSIVSIGILLGSYVIAHFVARGMVFSESAPVRWAGFFVGTVSQGVAMGYLLLSAMIVSAASFGSPFLLIAQAMGLVVLTAAGMLAYLFTGPKELSWVKGILAVMFLPMLVLMAVTLIFPIGGPLGILMSFVFVVISSLGLLYQFNVVLHSMRTDMHVQGAYTITMGLLVLFWNILVLLMKLNRR